MSSTFFGLEIGRRGLQAQQSALDVTSHNVANANTPGFTRQEAVLETTTPIPYPGLNTAAGPGQFGSGVGVAEVRRLRDAFLDLQYRNENLSLGYWETRRDVLQKVEVILNEPSDSGLCQVFEQFWESLQVLSKDPENTAARATVLERGKTLAETFNTFDRKLNELQNDLNSALKVKVEEVNSFARQIAGLNLQIMKIESTGQRANDLRDKRDLLLDQLSKDLNIQVREESNGMVRVSIGGRALVQGDDSYQLKVEQNSSNSGFYDVKWDDGSAVDITDGVMKGLLETRGYLNSSDGKQVGLIPGIRNMLDNLAQTFADSFNSQHKQGYGLDGSKGWNFFININNSDKTAPADRVAGIDAGNITVNPKLTLELIAASTVKPDVKNPTSGYNGDNALALAQLKQTPLDFNNFNNDGNVDATFEDYYRAAIGELGVQGQQAERMADNQAQLLAQVDNGRQAVSGVSLDEEMVNLIRFQHAYSAASRVITTLDEMLDTIISRMGLVGR